MIEAYRPRPKVDHLIFRAENAEILTSTTHYVLARLIESIGLEHNYPLYRDHANMFLAIIDYLQDRSPFLADFRKLMDDIRDSREALDKSALQAAQLLEAQPFKGLKVLEVGGPLGQVLHAMGAESWCIDPDINGVSEWTNRNWEYVPTVRPEHYHPIPVRLNASNWYEFILPNTFDLTYSRLLLSIGSGISSDWRRRLSYDYPYRKAVEENAAADAQARKELFLIAAGATKAGDIVIHQGDAVEELTNFSDEAGLDYLERRRNFIPKFPDGTLFIFRKKL